MRQPVIEYTIQFCMHAPMYTHVHTTLPPHTNSCESDRQRVQRAMRVTRSKTVIVTQKTQQRSVVKCNVVRGEGGHTLSRSQGGWGYYSPTGTVILAVAVI